LEVTYTIPHQEKTVDATYTPVMVAVRVPMMDENGVQKQYEVTRPVYEQIDILDEEGNVIGQRDGDIVGQEGTGQFLQLWTTEEVQEQDSDGNPLYWTTIEEPAVRYEAQPPLEITADSPYYVEGLEMAYETVEVPDPIQPEAPPTIPEQISEIRSDLTATQEAVNFLLGV
jgi:hypothetical protein